MLPNVPDVPCLSRLFVELPRALVRPCASQRKASLDSAVPFEFRMWSGGG